MSRPAKWGIEAIVRIQGCTTIPGRRAFVRKGEHRHGIAAGNIRYYNIIARNWTAVRSMVASLDTTGSRTMGFTNVGPDTVESWQRVHDVGPGSKWEASAYWMETKGGRRNG